MAITPWIHYADLPVAPICRSRPGSNVPVGDTRDAFDEAQALDDASNAVLAEQAAQELLVRYPEVPDGHERLGRVYEARGDHTRAVDCYRKVIEFIRAHPDNFDPQYEQFLLSKLDPPAES
jgi:tetratricopeptide (TPR) repeat protein